MNYIKRLVLIMGILYPGIVLLGQAKAHGQERLAEFMQRSLDSSVKRHKIFGAACNIMLPDGESWQGYSGTYDTTGKGYFRDDELYWTASITKMFVAVIIVQLSLEDKLGLDDPLHKYLPSYQWVDSQITIRQLLKHRSGLKDYLTTHPQPTRNFFQFPDSIWSPHFILTNYLSEPLFSRGSSFSYSNTNYLLLGMIIERVTGSKYHAELRRRILEPLGLRRTFMPPHEEIKGPVVKNWTDWNKDGVPDDASIMHSKGFASTVYTAGGMISHPGDIARFCHELHSGKFLKGATPQLYDFSNISVGQSNTGYGLGVMRYTINDKTYYGHAGDINGFTNLTIYSPADDLTLTVMINKDLQDRISLCRDILSDIDRWLQHKQK